MTQVLEAKDPDAVKDYGVDWSQWLGGDEIAESTFTLKEGADAGVTIMDGAKAPSHDETSTRVWISGGTAGLTAQIVNHIKTAAGREEDETLVIRIREN